MQTITVLKKDTATVIAELQVGCEDMAQMAADLLADGLPNYSVVVVDGESAYDPKSPVRLMGKQLIDALLSERK